MSKSMMEKTSDHSLDHGTVDEATAMAATLDYDPAAADETIGGHIPGTIHLVDLDRTMHVQHSGGGSGDIVLYPTPSRDPNDPLNWSRRRKLLQTFCLQLYNIAGGVGSATGYAVYNNIIDELGVSLGTLNSAAGLMFLFYGLGTLIWCPLGLQYGRRGVYIMSTLGTMAMNIWAPHTRNNSMWYAHRLLYGLFAAPVEALVEQSIPDVFFTHERGTQVGIYMMSLLVSGYGASMFSGYVAQYVDWKWCYYIPAIFSGSAAVFLYFFMEETMYDRELLLKQAVKRGAAINAGTLTLDPAKHIRFNDVGDNSASGPSPPVLVYEQPSYWQRMALFRSIPGKPNVLLKMVVHPIKHLYNYPIMLMSGFQYGCSLIVYSALNGVWASILQAPPYNFSTGITGLFFVCNFLGALLAMPYCGIFADWYHNRAARRNGGIREPEQRLILYVVPTLLLPAGMLLFGVGASDGIHWIGLAIGAVLTGFSLVSTGAQCIAYISDSYKDLTGEGMVSMTLVRNSLGFAIGYAITPWLEHSGQRDLFIEISMMGLGAFSLFFIFIFVGKKERTRTADRYHKDAARAVTSH